MGSPNYTPAASLALRLAGTAGCLAIGPARSPDSRQAVEAVLALHGVDNRAAEALVGVLSDAGAARQELTALLDRCGVAMRARGLPEPAVVLVRDGRYALRAVVDTVVLLLREEVLHQLSAEGDQGAVADGDALILCSAALAQELSEREIAEAVRRCATPARAVEELTAAAAGEGLVGQPVAVLYVGVGPALAGRLRSAEQDHTVLPGDDCMAPSTQPTLQPTTRVSAAQLASDGGQPEFGAGPLPGTDRAWSRVPLPAGLLIVSALLALGGVVFLAAQAARLGSEHVGLDPSPTTLRLAPSPQADQHPAASRATPSQPIEPGSGLSPQPGGPTRLPAVGLPTRSASVGTASGRGLTGRTLPAEPDLPPLHALAPGMSRAVRLTLGWGGGRRLGLTANQGMLQAEGVPESFPAGEALPVQLSARHDWSVDATVELRLLDAAGATVAATASEGLTRCARGEKVILGQVPPGDYRLVWWKSDAGTEPAAGIALRVSAF